jgi:hypothetical protein
MTQHYSDPSRENDPHALPDLETFQLTAREVAERDEDMIREYVSQRQYRLATMSGRVRDQMFDAMIEENGIEGGWFYWFCFPGCMPESDAMGPYATQAEALAAARESCGD